MEVSQNYTSLHLVSCSEVPTKERKFVAEGVL